MSFCERRPEWRHAIGAARRSIPEERLPREIEEALRMSGAPDDPAEHQAGDRPRRHRRYCGSLFGPLLTLPERRSWPLIGRFARRRLIHRRPSLHRPSDERRFRAPRRSKKPAASRGFSLICSSRNLGLSAKPGSHWANWEEPDCRTNSRAGTRACCSAAGRARGRAASGRRSTRCAATRGAGACLRKCEGAGQRERSSQRNCRKLHGRILLV
jgi:hypothetical protein